MKQETRMKCMKYSTVLGSVLLMLPNSLFWYWGNLSVYSMSFIYNVLGSTTDVNTPLVISTFVLFWPLGIITSGFVVSRIGPRNTVLVGAVLADLCVFSGYFANQHSVMALTFSMGAGLGCGTGFIDGANLQMVMEWADDDVGKLASVIQASFALGGVIINQIVTQYINPDNLVPEMTMGHVNFFVKKSILDKVPTTFFVLGAFAVCVHVTGFLMLRQRPKSSEAEFQEEGSVLTKSVSMQETDHHGTNTNHQGTNVTCEEGVQQNIVTTSQNLPENRTKSVSENEKHPMDYTPNQMLRAPSFYVMWIAFFLGDLPFIILTNYYKVFGQLYIHDDHFLTNLGTAFIFLNVFTNIFWGKAMDKFGVKNCLAAFMSTLVLIISWYYFTPMLSKWLYVVATLAMGSLVGCLFSCFTAATVLLYGKAHLATNFGILMTSSMTFNLVAPYMIEKLLLDLGWLAIFAAGAGSNILAHLGVPTERNLFQSNTSFRYMVFKQAVVGKLTLAATFYYSRRYVPKQTEEED